MTGCTCPHPSSLWTGGRDTKCPRHGDHVSVTRYAVYYPVRENPEEGTRTYALANAAQGRCTKATLEEAEEQVRNMQANNPADKIRQIFNCEPEDLRAFPVHCWPRHFDPKGIYHTEFINQGADT